jgi:MFS family permease
MIQTNTSIFRGNFVLLFFASLFIFTAFYILLPTLPVFLTQQLKIDERQTGIILAVYTLAALIIRPFAGYLIDRYGRKLFYISSILLFSVIFIVYPLAGLFMWILIVRFMHGMAWGVATTTGSTLIVDIIPATRRGEGIGLYGLSMTIPMALGPFTGLLIARDNNFTFMFLSAGIISFVGFLLTIWIKYPSIPVIVTKKFSWRNLLEKSAFPVTFNLLLVNISYGGLVSFISIYALNTGIGYTGIFFLIFAGGITLARLYMGKFFDRNGPKILAIGGILFLITGHLILGLILNTSGFLTAAFMLGLGSGIVFPTFQAMVNNLVPPHRRGAANSTLFSGLDLGIGLGMLITGLLAQSIGLPHTYLLFSALNMVALFYFLFKSLTHYHKTIKTMLS